MTWKSNCTRANVGVLTGYLAAQLRRYCALFLFGALPQSQDDETCPENNHEFVVE